MRVVVFLGMLAVGCAAVWSPGSVAPARARSPGWAVELRAEDRPRAWCGLVSPRRGPAGRPCRYLATRFPVKEVRKSRTSKAKRPVNSPISEWAY